VQRIQDAGGSGLMVNEFVRHVGFLRALTLHLHGDIQTPK
jgi:hypothetical protein